MKDVMMVIKRIVFSILSILTLSAMVACSAVIDEEGAKIGNPRDFAEATHIARLSEESAYATQQAVMFEATRQAASIKAVATSQAGNVAATATSQAISAYAFKADADISRARADAEQNALPAATAGKALAYFGFGVGALVVVVGLAFASVAWVNKRATSIYPDKRGQFPVIVRRGIGWVAFHDPNRGLGPATVVKTPTALDAVAGVILAIKAGAPTTEPKAAFPLPGSEPAMLQVATQAQAAQMRIAENPELPKLMVSMNQAEPARPGTARGRMPSVTLVNDPRAIQVFEKRLLGDGSDA